MLFSPDDMSTWPKSIDIPWDDEIYEASMWRPGTPIPEDEDFASIDTETELIIIGEAPRPVLMQVAHPRSRVVHMVWHTHMNAYIEQLLRNSDIELVFYNAPFDVGVMGFDRETIIELMESYRISDMAMRFILTRLREGKYYDTWSLDHACKQLFGTTLPKDPDIRLTFKQTMDLTQRHFEYAARDAVVTAELRLLMSEWMPTEHLMLCGYFALDSISKAGMHVDFDYLQKKEDELKEEQQRTISVLDVWGHHPGEAGVALALEKNLGILVHREREREGKEMLDLPRTPKSGKYKSGSDVAGLFEEDIPYLESLADYDHATKMLSTYCCRDLIGKDGRVHPHFSPMVKTGRTSCSKPNLQNPPRKGGIRGIYTASPGCVLLATDYSQLELCALSQSCLSRFGESTMAEVINSGEDVHKWFGEIIMEAAGGVPYVEGTPENMPGGTNWRQMAKACNFGYPGGLGYQTFMTLARKAYGVRVDRETAEQLKYLWLDAFPEMKNHLKPVPGNYGYVDGESQQLYIASTLTGRVRGNASYCSACNYEFQGLSADGGRLALWYLYCEYLPMVNFIHDEIIVELPEDDKLQSNIRLVESLMIEAMQQVIPDVLIGVESTLTRRWYKEAKEIRDEEGNLKVWTPNNKKETAA